MKIKKPYTISESEKVRIMGLHSKMVINEETGWEDTNYDKDELEEISDWANDYDDGDDDWMEEMGEEELTDLNGSTYHVAEEVENGRVDVTVRPTTGSPMPLGPGAPGPYTSGDGIPTSTIPGGLPKGWKMLNAQEIGEEESMSDLYEVWLGHEETQLFSEGISNITRRPKKEQIYELPKRFGNRRMTESELVTMVNAIVN